MEGMFQVAKAFKQPLEDWDVSAVKDMSWMFAYATSFNQPLDKWNSSAVAKTRNISNIGIGSAAATVLGSELMGAAEELAIGFTLISLFE